AQRSSPAHSSRAPASSRASRRASARVTCCWRSGGSVSHTAAGATASSRTARASCPDIVASLFEAGWPAARTALGEDGETLREQPPGRGSSYRPELRLLPAAPREV